MRGAPFLNPPGDPPDDPLPDTMMECRRCGELRAADGSPCPGCGDQPREEDEPCSSI